MKGLSIFSLPSALLAPRSCYGFSKIQAEGIRNTNLRFEADSYYINMYPFYPQVYKKKEKNVYEVSHTSTVLALTFLDKKLDYLNSWEQRKTISFRFKEVGKLLSAQVRSGREVKIETVYHKQNQEKTKTIVIKDLKEQEKMHIRLITREDSSQNSDLIEMQQPANQDSIETTISYSEYLIIYKIIENSLLDLSGWRFMMEIQKRQQINKLDNKFVDEKEIADLLKN